MTRTSRKKKMQKRRRISFLIILTLILISSVVFGSKVMTKHKLKAYVEEHFANEMKPSTDNKNVGEVKSNIDYDKNSLLAVHYPKLDNKDVNKDIDNIIKEYTDNFKKETKDFEALEYEDIKDLHIDYESYKYKDTYNSIKFKVNEDTDRESFKVVTYNIKDGKRVTFNDLFIEEALPYVSNQSIGYFASQESTKEAINNAEFVESLRNDVNNYSDFIMHDDGIEFLIDKISKDETVKIDYKDLEMYTKYNLDTLEALSDEEIEEKVESAQRGTKIRPGLDPKKPMIALTYDDGPSTNATGAILDQLNKYNSAATFFVLGQNAKVNPDLIKRMADEGHEIGNHSYSHKQLTKLSIEELNREVNDTQAVIRDIVGFEPTLLRPTYGAINDTVKENVPMPLMLWSIDTLDWKHRDAQRVTSSILNHVKDGDIVLMHDLYTSTKDASLIVIPELVNRGYQLVTISEMYQLKGQELEPGGRYTNID